MRSDSRVRILLVHDDPAVVDTARKAFDRHISWTYESCAYFHEATEMVQRGADFEVVIAGTSGAALQALAFLTSAKEAKPAALRVALLSTSQCGAVAQALGVAHQVLPESFSPSALEAMLVRTLEHELFPDDAAMAATIKALSNLPSPPEDVMTLNRILSSLDPSVDEVAAVVSHDPAMTAKLLQLVNSPFFGLRQRISDPRQAIAYLGMSTVRNLLTAVEIVRSLAPVSGEMASAVERIHTRSISVAETARNLMGKSNGAHDTFTVGMLHDIGRLAVLTCLPEKFVLIDDVAEASNANPSLRMDVELSVLGTTFAQLGAYLLTLWGLPRDLVDAVARSGDAHRLEDRSLSSAHAVFVAQAIVDIVDTQHQPSLDQLPNHDYLSDLGIAESVEQMISGSTRSNSGQ